MATSQRPAQEPKVDYEMVEHNGQMVRKYPNGDLRGEHGHIVGQTRERARELALKRKEQGTQVVRQRIRDKTGSESFTEGYGKLVDKMVEAVMSESGRSRNDAMRFLALAAGAYAVNQPLEVQHNVQNNANLYQVPQAYLDALAGVLRENEVVDGETDEG